MQSERSKYRICPSPDALDAYRLQRLAPPEVVEIEIHLQICPNCTEQLEFLRQLAQEETKFIPAKTSREVSERLSLNLPRFSLPRRDLTNEVLTVGQLWATKAEVMIPGDSTPILLTNDPRLVLVVVDDTEAYDPEYPEIRIVPLSTDVRQACHLDLILSGEENPLGFDVMLECWNSQPMLKCNLDRLLHSLDDTTMQNVFALLEHSSTPDAIEGQPVALRVGPPLERETDPRVHFQSRELTATEYLRGPVNQLPLYWEEKAQQETGTTATTSLWKILSLQPAHFDDRAASKLWPITIHLTSKEGEELKFAVDSVTGKILLTLHTPLGARNSIDLLIAGNKKTIEVGKPVFICESVQIESRGKSQEEIQAWLLAILQLAEE